MRSYAPFVIIALMSIGLVFLVVTRPQAAYQAPAEVFEAALDGGADAADGAATVADASAAPPAKALEKPLRITSLGWDLVAPGVALTPPPSPAGAPPSMPFELAPETSLDAIEARLARGGADPQGADIAILPLPALVASFDRLRALDPRAFAVVGFSHGREEFHALPGVLQKPLTGTDEIKLIALGPTTAPDPAARAMGSESATIVGLFALDLAGAAPSRLRFVGPSTPEAKGAPFAALVKGAPDERPRAFSTADASRLVPIVAVAPKALLDAKTAAIRSWATSWFDGLAKAKRDVPGVARRLAAKEGLPLAQGVTDAEGALSLVERLGQIDDVSLEQQSAFIGPLAKGETTLEKLTQRTWRLARSGGLTSSPSPDPLPIDARIVPTTAPPAAAPPAPADADAGAFASLPSGSVPNVVYRAATGEASEVAAQIAFLAGVFERGIFKIAAKGGEKAAKGIAEAAREKGVSPARLVVVATDPGGPFAVVEVLSPP